MEERTKRSQPLWAGVEGRMAGLADVHVQKKREEMDGGGGLGSDEGKQGRETLILKLKSRAVGDGRRECGMQKPARGLRFHTQGRNGRDCLLRCM